MAITSNVTVIDGPLGSPELLVSIFSFLPPADLSRASQVCITWASVAHDCWKNLLAYKSTKYRFVEDFRSYVANGSMTWQEAYRYSDLIRLFTKILESEFRRSSYIRAENPTLKDKKSPWRYMLQPWVSYENTNLSICNSSDVKVQKKGEGEFIILKGESGQMLTRLAIENDFLFALRNDGYIVQYNLRTWEQNKIPTSWVLGQISLKNQLFHVDNFHVEGGYIIIRYGGASDHVFETIPYSNPEGREVFIDDNVPMPHRILVEQGRLYMLGVNKIFIWDLSKNERIENLSIDVDHPSYCAYDIALAHNMIFVTKKNALHIIHPTQTTLKKEIQNLYHIMIIENLLFGAYGPKEARGTTNLRELCTGIAVIDLNTGRRLGDILDVLQNPTTDGIKPEILMQLVKICRLYCQKFIPPQVPSETSCTIV